MDWPIEAFIKFARQGAICLLPTSKGRYLMQDDSFGTWFKPKLRPPGGGKEPEDKTLTDTIVRELHEEFGLEEKDVRERIEFLGYTPQAKYWGTPVYRLKQHGLKPGIYQASNSPDEKVKLVEVDLAHPNYTGPQPHKLITEEAKKIGDKLRKEAGDVELKDGVLPGGVAEEKGKKPGDFSTAAVTKGMAVEEEHTNNKSLQKAIATDHLVEDPRYYEKNSTAAPDPLLPYLDFTKRYEGVRPQVYRDTVGVPTVGVGMNLQNPSAAARLQKLGVDFQQLLGGKTNLNASQINALYREDMASALAAARKFVPNFDSHPEPARKIVADLSFNLGPKLGGFKKFLGHMTAAQPNYTGAAAELRNSNWFGQVGRRSAEHVATLGGLAAPRPPVTTNSSPAAMVKKSAANAAELFRQVAQGQGQSALSKRLQRLRLRQGRDPETGEQLSPEEFEARFGGQSKSARFFNYEELEAWGRSPEEGQAVTDRIDRECLKRQPDVVTNDKKTEIKEATQGDPWLQGQTQATGGPVFQSPVEDYRELAAGDRAGQWQMWGDLEDEMHGRNVARNPLPGMWHDEVGGIPKAAGFIKPENYDKLKDLSTEEFSIWIGENDWETRCSAMWVVMGGEDSKSRVWVRLKVPKEDAGKFDGNYGRELAKQWVAKAGEIRKRRAEELEMERVSWRLEDFEQAVSDLPDVDDHGMEKTEWHEKLAAALETKATTEQLVSVPKTGPEAIAWALANVDLTKKEAEARTVLEKKLKSKRPDAVKMLGYIEGFKRSGLTPSDLVLDKVPVIPPQFRPYSVAGDVFVPGDANELYRDLLNLRDVHGELESRLGKSGAGFNKLNIYDAVKALYGYGEPTSPKTRERGVSGFLKKVTGTNPKFSFAIRRLIGKNQDYVGRGVIAPDPDLGLDEIGLPEDMVWKLYAPYVQRRLVRGGMKMEEAVKAITDRTPHAGKHLDLELKERPVMYNRDPSWHKFNSIGGYVKRVPGSTIMINPLVTTGISGDFDGDAIGVHLPSLDSAVDDVKEKLMPSKMLFSIKDPKKVVPAPKHEQIWGLWSAQQRPSKNTWNFNSEKEALAAVRSGKISLSDEVTIGGVP